MDNRRAWENLGLILSDGSFRISGDLHVRFFAGGVGDQSMTVGHDSMYAYIAFTRPSNWAGQDVRLCIGEHSHLELHFGAHNAQVRAR